MLATQDVETVPARMTPCSICQKMVRVNPLKTTDVGVICRMCRCRRCSIPMSSKPCERCGVAHGTPSTQPGLCERCFETSVTRTVVAVRQHHESPVLSDPLWQMPVGEAENSDGEFLL